MSSHPEEMRTMRELVEQLRRHMEQLRLENDELRHANRELRSLIQMQQLQQQQRTPTRQSAPLAEIFDPRRSSSRSEPQSGAYTPPHQESRVRQTHSGFGSELPSDPTEARWTPEPSAYEPQPPAYEPHSVRPGIPAHIRDDIGLYQQPARTPEGLSGHMGRGVDPAYAQQRGVAPSQPVARRPIDLGYVNHVGPEELDALPYGLVVLDATGNVLFYNETESALTGFARERVIGKNFFGEVAPCTRVKEFKGRFEQFVAGELGRVTFFDFAFHFERGTQNVLIGLSHGRKRGHINVMMVRK